MKKYLVIILLALPMLMILTKVALAQKSSEEVGISPWGPDDEIGTLNMMTQSSRLAVLSKIASGKCMI